MMKTGQGDMDTSEIENAALDLFLPVLESATVLAAHYCKACQRNTITAEDMSYGLMYAARHVTGKQVGSLYPEIYEDEQDSGTESDPEADSDSGPEDEAENPWTKYEGTDNDMACKMNECANTWNEWTPETPAERALKDAVDKNSFFGRA